MNENKKIRFNVIDVIVVVLILACIVGFVFRGTLKEKIGKIISNTESITSNLKNNNDELNNIISKIGQITDTVAQAQLGSTILQTTQTLEKLNNVLGVIEKGKGNIGLLINDEGLYKSLDESAKKLDALIEDIKANPKKYINVSVF